MALDQPQISVVAAHYDRKDRIVVTLKLILTENNEEVLNLSFSQNHNPNNPVSSSRDALLEKMQLAIDDYKKGRQLLNSPALANAVDHIQSHLEV